MGKIQEAKELLHIIQGQVKLEKEQRRDEKNIAILNRYARHLIANGIQPPNAAQIEIFRNRDTELALLADTDLSNMENLPGLIQNAKTTHKWDIQRPDISQATFAIYSTQVLTQSTEEQRQLTNNRRKTIIRVTWLFIKSFFSLK